MNYTKTQHSMPYAAISPSLPQLSAVSKSVLITGGSTGIGKATALAFLAAGCRSLALTGRRAALLSATTAEIKDQYPEAQVLIFAVDITDISGMDAAFKSARSKLGSLDVVVNNAGYQPTLKTLAATDLDEWWRGFEINVKGAAVVAQCVAKYAAGDAVVLHLGTAGALFPAAMAPPMSAYAASKLASVKVMEYFGAENKGMRVISVHPGVVPDTEGGQRMVKESGMDWPGDDINLPAHFLVWAASAEAEFLKNKFVFAGWDVEELKARKDEIAQSPELLIGLNGFPRSV
ncbi:NAD(P)-binding protein [Hypomontagnella submonticulosa]|nr:NAD(P)-binding protein [Hypomontagnella submonticulosa]